MIDEKGRLFGKINIVDLLVIIVVVILAVVLGMKLFGAGGALAGPGAATKLTYTVRVNGVQPAVYEDIQKWIPGDPLMASGSLLPGQVLAVEAQPHDAVVTLDTTDGALELPLEEGLLDLTFTIEVDVTNLITNEVGTQEVRIGKSHIVKTQHFELSGGIIQACDWESPAA